MKITTHPIIQFMICLTPQEAELLIEVGKLHYDSECKRYAKNIELYYRDSQTLYEEGQARVIHISTSSRDYQLLSKIMETAHWYVQALPVKKRDETAKLSAHLIYGLSQGWVRAQAYWGSIGHQEYIKDYDY